MPLKRVLGAADGLQHVQRDAPPRGALPLPHRCARRLHRRLPARRFYILFLQKIKGHEGRVTQESAYCHYFEERPGYD